MKCQLSKKHLDKINQVTFLVPTHNRKKLLIRCLNSIKALFGSDCNIIICDNSSKEYDKLNDVITNEEYIDLRSEEFNLQKVYQTLIENVKTKYCIFVEDDDQLVNLDTHLKCIDQLLNGYKIVTFGAYDDNEQYMLREFNDELINIPFFWNGEFQFGMAYFEIDLLKKAFYRWIEGDDKSFVINSDEAITFIAIIDQNNYMHIPKIGMKIGIQNDNLSWGNIALTIYSSLLYIDFICKILQITDNNWKNKYILIQNKELMTMYSNKNIDEILLKFKKLPIFANKFSFSINKKKKYIEKTIMTLLKL